MSNVLVSLSENLKSSNKSIIKYIINMFDYCMNMNGVSRNGGDLLTGMFSDEMEKYRAWYSCILTCLVFCLTSLFCYECTGKQLNLASIL